MTSTTGATDPDGDEIRRLVMVTRGGEHTGENREAWIITLQSGREVILIIPQRTANELESMHGYVGRIRAATDDDNVEMGTETEVSKLKRRREEGKGAKG